MKNAQYLVFAFGLVLSACGSDAEDTTPDASNAANTGSVHSASCAENSVADTMPLACPVTFKFSSLAFVGKTATMYMGCGIRDIHAPHGWDALCTDVSCSSSGDCVCKTVLPKTYWVQMNGQVSSVWAVGAGNGGVIVNYKVYVNDVLLTADDAVSNAQDSGYNFQFQVDC